MTAHPNRGPKGPYSTPTPAEIRAAREAAGLTQTGAAELVRGTLRAWQGWEAPGGTQAARRMHPGLWELFNIKISARTYQLQGGLTNDELENALRSKFPHAPLGPEEYAIFAAGIEWQQAREPVSPPPQATTERIRCPSRAARRKRRG